MKLEDVIKNELTLLFTTAETETFEYDEQGKQIKKVVGKTISPEYKEKIDRFAKNLAKAILDLKVDLNTASNPLGKLNIVAISNTPGLPVLWESTSQANGGLKDE